MYTYQIPSQCVAALTPPITELSATIRLPESTITILLTEARIESDRQLGDTQLEDIFSMLASIALYF